ncbi:MAG TPA: peroxide stress protein YaaA [Noviherbaspirillum sp.]|nr:peroxide stress protein YaaA [Noviherbaspirillum sp.]
MLIVLSPAKTLDYDTPAMTEACSLPDFIEDSTELIDTLRPMSPSEVGSLMSISDALATLNVARFASWSREFTPQNAKQAILAFNGDVYEGLDASTLNKRQLDYAQSHIRILSGLYGVLRPLDLMQPYRLEMGTRLANPRGKDLYAFWGSKVTEALNAAIGRQQSRTLVNLASEEYFKVVKPKLLDADIITPVFEDWKDGRYKIISFYAKRARGLMARYAAVKGITQAEKLKAFDIEGYAFDPRASSEHNWVFRRRAEA